jgi:hypothetical protein
MLMVREPMALSYAFSSREPVPTSLENALGKNRPLVTKQSWRFDIKLSIIIDNLIQARRI